MARTTAFLCAYFQEGHSFLFSVGVVDLSLGQLKEGELENFQQRVF